MENLRVILRLGCSSWGGSVAQVVVSECYTHHNLCFYLHWNFIELYF